MVDIDDFAPITSQKIRDIAIHHFPLPESPLAPQEPEWPQLIPQSLLDDAVQEFKTGTNFKVETTCAVCARRSFNLDLLFTTKTVHCQRIDAHLLALQHLRINDDWIAERHKHHFQFGHAFVGGLVLEAAGVHILDDMVELDDCDDCRSHLTGPKAALPPLSLANDNFRGVLPEHLRDCTWLEERFCAKYLALAHIVHSYDISDPGAPEARARVMKGHACSFPLNTISTAIKLPRALDDGALLLSCLVIGPRKPRIEDLRSVFKVKKQKVVDLMEFLCVNFKDYPQFPIDEDALNQLPEDDVPELLMRSIVFQEKGDVPSLFEAETTGLDKHPDFIDDEDTKPSGRTFLEHHGLLDVNGVNIPAHQRRAAALANATGGYRPDLVIKHGSTFIQDYNNPALFPGMYPTLFPWGTGGFEAKRPAVLSFGRQASHLLDLADPAFRQHWSYIFVVANIKQRRLIHLGTRLACKSRDHERTSKALQQLDTGVLESIGKYLASGGSFLTANDVEARVHTLLKQCELVSVKVPGSKAAMNRARSDIRGYVGWFGNFHLFLTLNPSPVHSPVFQVLYGDNSVNLDLRIPTIPASAVRAVRIADNPLSAADYFHFHVHAVFKYLFGWDAHKGKSSTEGGIFGPLNAFFLVKEHTKRGQLHGHALIWLKGGLNPRDLRNKMKDNAEFQKRFLDFFDSLIHHHLPPAPASDISKRKPCQDPPPPPPPRPV